MLLENWLSVICDFDAGKCKAANINKGKQAGEKVAQEKAQEASRKCERGGKAFAQERGSYLYDCCDIRIKACWSWKGDYGMVEALMTCILQKMVNCMEVMWQLSIW